MSEEKEVIKREAVGTIEGTGDGRTLDLRVVPWNKPTRVTDNNRDYYIEEWLPGCFDNQVPAPNRVEMKDKLDDSDQASFGVLMNFEHERGIGGVIGRGTELRNAPEGFEGTFRMLNAADADKALELVSEGVLTGVSLEAQPKESRNEDGIVKRVKATLVNVALCRSPAYVDAKVIAVRKGEPDALQNVKDALDALGDDGAKQLLDTLEAEKEPAVRSDVDDLLERIGYEPLISRAVTKKPWDGSPARFEDVEYQRSCLIDRGGDAPVKERCSLPVLEPNGDLNTNALGQAAGRLNQTKASTELKAKAARKLMRYYRQASMEPPASLRMMASR